jgi:predicted transposase YdaD
MTLSRIEQFVRNFTENAMKLLLEHSANVHDLLALGRAEVLDLIDFARMKPAGKSFVARDYRHIEADVVLTAPLRRKGRSSGESVLIYILIEHQSEPDELMAFRVLEYVVQIYRTQIRTWSKGRTSLRGIRLQPVFPVVFYTGTRTWNAIGTLADLIDMGDHFARRTPALDPLFINLNGLKPGVLEAEGGFFGQVLRLVRQRRAKPQPFRALLAEVVADLERMPDTERFRWLDLLSYIDAFLYHERASTEHPQLYELVQESVRTDTHREEIMTIRRTMADVLKHQGKQEGKIEQAHEGLLRQLAKRFGEVPPAVEATVKKTTNLAQLDEWIDRFATATSLEDVGIPSSP